MRFCGFCGSPLAAAYQNPPAEPAETAPPETPPVAAPVKAMPMKAAKDPVVPVAESKAPAPPVVEAPPPAPTTRAKPTIAVPDSPIAREVERDKLMTMAGVQRARGQVTDARETLEKALVMAEGGSPREIAVIQEQIGELLMIEDDLEGAAAMFQEALKTDPSRVSAEKKYAAAQMEISDRQAEKRLGQKALQGDSMAEILTSGGLSGRAGRRNAGLAMILSLVPGFGQFYNGQFAKGAMLLATFSLAMGILTFTSDGKNLMQSFAATIALHPGKGAPVSPMTIAVGVIGFAAWLYSIVDAPFFASKTSEAVEVYNKPNESIDLTREAVEKITGEKMTGKEV